MAWFELSQSGEQFRFTLKAGNGEIILSSESYTSKAAAQNGIASVQTNSGDDARYSRETAKDGRAYFTLKAANHQIIGTSQMYASSTGRDAGIESVKKNGSTTTIKET